MKQRSVGAEGENFLKLCGLKPFIRTEEQNPEIIANNIVNP